MADLKLPFFGALQGSERTLVNDWFGYKPIVVGNELVVPEKDQALQKGPKDVLKLHSKIDLITTSERAAAKKMVSAIPRDFDDIYRHGEITNHTISGNFGVISRIEKAIAEITITEKHHLVDLLAESVIPLMKSEFGARYVAPISMNAILQQQFNSFSKFALLQDRYGIEATGSLINERNALGGIEMTGGLDILSFIEPLTRINPVLFTYPLQREGCVWHFYSDAGSVLNIQGARSMIDQFSPGLTPRYDKIGMNPHLPNLNADSIWRLLRVSVRGTNNLMRYLNDPRTFADENGKVDWLMQVKARGLILLLFSDFNALCTSYSPHERINFAFSILDKIANIRKELGGIISNESALSIGGLSISEAKKLRNLFRSSYRDIAPLVGKMLAQETTNAYRRLHLKIGRQSKPEKRSEEDRLKKLRAFRNLNHGTYLKNDQFDLLFLESFGGIPEEIGTIPWLLIHALIADPEQFIKFDPS